MDLHRFGPPEGKDLRLAFACIDFGGGLEWQKSQALGIEMRLWGVSKRECPNAQQGLCKILG
jgi:hypothetical protein